MVGCTINMHVDGIFMISIPKIPKSLPIRVVYWQQITYAKKSWISSECTDRFGSGRKYKIQNLRYCSNHNTEGTSKTIYVELKDNSVNTVTSINEELVINIFLKRQWKIVCQVHHRVYQRV